MAIGEDHIETCASNILLGMIFVHKIGGLNGSGGSEILGNDRRSVEAVGESRWERHRPEL